MEKLILDFCDLQSTGLMTEEIFYLAQDKPRMSDTSDQADIEVGLEPIMTAPVRNYQTRGSYKKPLLFITAPKTGFHTDHETGLLENILKALNLSIDDIAFLEISSGNQVSLQALLDAYKPRLLLSFGAEEMIDGWPHEFILNEPIKHDQVMYLKGVSLQRLNNDKNEKFLLWTALKILFKIK